MDQSPKISERGSKFLTHILRSCKIECLILLAFYFLFAFLRGEQTSFITADGMGYYEYLPSALIHHDFVRKDFSVDEHPEKYRRIRQLYVYIQDDDKLLDKYSCGTALLQMPFFVMAQVYSAINGIPVKGYEKPFQLAVLFAALFYLFLALVLMRRWMLLLAIKKTHITLLQVLLVFATPVFYYASFDAAFSHIYSLFAVQLFTYLLLGILVNKKHQLILPAGIALGLVILLRPINAMVLVFVPFVAGAAGHLQALFHLFAKRPVTVVTAALAGVGVFMLHPMAVWLQTGNWRINTYLYEAFHFNDPHFFDILFSFQKGLFLYTPLAALAVMAVIYFVWRKNYLLFFLFSLGFLSITYVFSSWWNWQYGCSFGQRVYIEYLGFLVVPAALFLQDAGKVVRITWTVCAWLCVPLNLIQVYQYQHYILHWDQMDREKYQKVFLQTGEAYQGLLWHPYIPTDAVELGRDSLASFAVHSPSSSAIISPSSEAAVDSANFITLSFKGEIKEAEKIKLCFLVIEKNTAKKLSVIETFLNHFNKNEKGEYTQNFACTAEAHSGDIVVHINSYSQVNARIYDLRIVYLRGPSP
jgi:hypothetical protein